MKIPVVLFALAAGLGVVSCGGTNPPPPGDSQPVALNTNGPGRTEPTAGPSAPRPQAPAAAADDVPPPDAHYMLSCAAIKGAGHVQQAMAIKEKLIHETHMPAWHIVHSEQQSILCYGYYREYRDEKREPKEVARARADQHRLTDLIDGLGNRYFTQCVFVPINEADPDAPSQWDLARTPPDAFWSVQIGAYQGSPERKQAAVDEVRGLRAKNIEAYYYHGDTISSVCVGKWSRSAVQQQGAGVNAAGQVRDDAHADDPNRSVVVLPEMLPSKVADEITKRANETGNRVQVQQQKIEILDESLLKAFRENPYHFVNGEYHYRTVKGEKVWDPSLLVQIPHAPGVGQPGGAVDDIARNAAEPNDNGADQAVNDLVGGHQEKPAFGTLHSIDEQPRGKQ
jgi:hypothetical protein